MSLYQFEYWFQLNTILNIASDSLEAISTSLHLVVLKRNASKQTMTLLL